MSGKLLRCKTHAKTIKSELCVSPINNYIHSKKKQFIQIYEESDSGFIVPRFWFSEHIKEEEYENLHGQDQNIISTLSFKSELREEQREICSDVLNSLQQENGLILSLPCGFGKTVISIYIFTMLRRKTLVIVNKSFLMDQWKERLEQFTDCKIGSIRQNVIDVEGKDIVIGMLQSICSRDYEESIFQGFDFVIVDEVHNIATEKFSKSLLKLKCKYSLGLSATPNRKDGLSFVYQLFLGKKVLSHNTNEKKKVILRNVSYRNMCTGENPLFEMVKLRSGDLNLSAIITNVCSSVSRNMFVLELIPRETIRYTLILSSRISQLTFLHDEFKKKYPDKTCSLYIGKMKKEQLNISSRADVIFSTYEMVSEGFDLPKLNCIVFASSRTNIEQSVGRILRNNNPQVLPLIIDICDYDIPVFISQQRKRNKFYKEKYTVCM